MRTVIEGGWVVAWNGRGHEVHESGSVVFEGDRVVHAGGPWSGPADTRIAARGKLVSPGFINTHVHTAGNGGDYLLLDMAKNDYRTSNYMSFAAPLKGKMTPPPPEATAALRTYVFLHALKNGTTTIIDVGGLRRLGRVRAAGRRPRGARLRRAAVPRPRHLHGRAGAAHLR